MAIHQKDSFFQNYFQKPIDKTAIAWYNNAVNPKTAGSVKPERFPAEEDKHNSSVQETALTVLRSLSADKGFFVFRFTFTVFLKDYQSSVF